ncbi:YicC/YloC family endoribonuclease [Porphyromonadaceae bacterium W3.11]|nr:YicC/YloC family endoribonuclease [Porphyromonadaceae bacterium W3.11]
MIHSMTGFGKAEAKSRNKKITVELRSVNSKQADINLRFPSDIRHLEMPVRKLITEELQRGKIDVFINLEQLNEEPNINLNADLAKKYWDKFQEFSNVSGVPLPKDPMRTILSLPGVMQYDVEENPEQAKELESITLNAIKEACQQLNEFRNQEGESLYQGFVKNITSIQELLATVDPYEKERITEIRERLEDGLKKYIDIDYDHSRLEQEMIYYIEKLDVNEEKNRLSNHLEYFLNTLEQDEVGQGRKLGFIAQEIGREINTLGSKSNHATLQKIVVKMKDELEQIKEQVLNVL